MHQNIMVRDYKTKDYRDIVEAGYPFSTTMFGMSFELKRKILDIAEQLERNFLVAYSLDKKKAVGLVTLKEINGNLWGIWDIFVSPTHRGRRISSLLYQASFDYLRKRGVRKAVGSVRTANMASIRSIERNWDRFLSQGFHFYKYSGKALDIQNTWRKGIVLRDFNLSDRNSLFEIYKQCANEDWLSFLEIDSNNFLDRFIQYPCYTGLLRLLIRKEILIAEKQSWTMGYVIVSVPRLPIYKNTVRLYLFMSSKLSTREAIALIIEISNLMLSRKLSNIYMYSIGTNDQKLLQIANELRIKFGFTVSKNLVAVNKF